MSINTNSGVARLKSRLDFLCYTLACREKMSSQAETMSQALPAMPTPRGSSTERISLTISRPSARLSHNYHYDDQATE